MYDNYRVKGVRDMKLLRVVADGFKNCADDFEISLVPLARKTSEDKEYELEEIADGLFTYATLGIVGKNASGKTSALELLSICHEILWLFRVNKKTYSVDNVSLTIYFFHDGNIYSYKTLLKEDPISDKIIFENQELRYKKYFKSKVNEIFEDIEFVPYKNEGVLPEDTSIIFFVIKKLVPSCMYFSSFDVGHSIYNNIFSAKKAFEISDEVLMKIIRIFDENITQLKMIDDNNYQLKYSGRTEKLSSKQLYYRLSSGTTRGMELYTYIIISLKNGIDVIIDEIENHFHKTLVENIISLYKDKSVNKKNASLIFATHYCEVLDLFNRQDNIYITKADKKVHIQNMYRDYDVRPELLKSKQFYNDTFNTAVNYESLMDLKKELKK